MLRYRVFFLYDSLNCRQRLSNKVFIALFIVISAFCI